MKSMITLFTVLFFAICTFSSPALAGAGGKTDGSVESSARREGREVIFDANWGPKARMLGQVAQEASYRLDDIKDWAEKLSPVQLAMFLIGVAILLVGSFWAFSKYLPTHGIPSNVTVGVLVSTIVAGLAFTVWLAFHMSGALGEYVAMVIMGLLGLSAALSVGGGLLCGKGLVCKLVAPVLMLVVSGIVFLLTMSLVLLVIVILFAVFGFDFLRRTAGTND